MIYHNWTFSVIHNSNTPYTDMNELNVIKLYQGRL